jgi:ribonuclease HI
MVRTSPGREPTTPKTQLGFRKGKGTNKVLAHLVIDAQMTRAENKVMACLFVDLKDAYNPVNPSVLSSYLGQTGLSEAATNAITGIFTNRRTFLRDNRTNLIGPQYTSLGSRLIVLSPLLFNLYTANLRQLWDRDIVCIQYADDICICCLKATTQECVTELRYIAYILNRWCQDHGFSLSTEKSALLFFCRQRQIPYTQLKLNNLTNPVVNEIKYLGVYLDRKLTWKVHVTYVQTRCKKGVNLLRAVARRSWGGAQEVCVLLYTAYIRSILDYACVWFGAANVCVLNQLVTVQHKAIRQALGVMQSTPNMITYAESGEKPLPLRREFPAKKILFEWQCTGEKNLSCKATNLAVIALTSKYWNAKKLPPLVKVYMHDPPALHGDCEFPTAHPFHKKYDDLITLLSVFSPKYSDCPTDNTRVLLDMFDSLPSNTIRIYTDGSKMKEGTGCAFLAQPPSHSEAVQSYKLSPQASIFTAEAMAIYKALIWLFEGNDPGGNALILSVSQSVINGLQQDPHQMRNYLLLDIVELVKRLGSRGMTVAFAWVKGHVKIQGNEQVDTFAKAALEWLYQISAEGEIKVMSNYYTGKWVIMYLTKNLILRKKRSLNCYEKSL